MVKLRLLNVVLVLMLSILPSWPLLAEVEEPISDVRILIDVSGSMKKNDPQNLCSPALAMIVGLLPDGSNAGVWTFAKYVNMLVKHDKVDDDWRQIAEQQTGKIHSKGLFTNIVV